MKIGCVLQIVHLQKQPPALFCKKKLFLEILQNSHESTCARDFF